MVYKKNLWSQCINCIDYIIKFLTLQQLNRFLIPNKFVYNSKRSDLQCLIGCGGYTGISKENIKTTCNHCNTVCSGPLEVRKKWMKLLFRSVVVELDEEGREVVVQLDEQGNRRIRRPALEVH